MENPYRSGCGVGLTGRIRAAVMSESGTGDNQRAGLVVPCPARSAAQCLELEVCSSMSGVRGLPPRSGGSISGAQDPALESCI